MSPIAHTEHKLVAVASSSRNHRTSLHQYMSAEVARISQHVRSFLVHSSLWSDDQQSVARCSNAGASFYCLWVVLTLFATIACPLKHLLQQNTLLQDSFQKNTTWHNRVFKETRNQEFPISHASYKYTYFCISTYPYPLIKRFLWINLEDFSTCSHGDALWFERRVAALVCVKVWAGKGL